VLLLKRLHVREKETLPLKLQKEVQLQGEESALPVVRRKAALREKHLREKVALREKLLREKQAAREKLLREKAALRSEKEDKQYLPLISPFYFFN
jgi:hypothetical protein